MKRLQTIVQLGLAPFTIMTLSFVGFFMLGNSTGILRSDFGQYALACFTTGVCIGSLDLAWDIALLRCRSRPGRYKRILGVATSSGLTATSIYLVLAALEFKSRGTADSPNSPIIIGLSLVQLLGSFSWLLSIIIRILTVREERNNSRDEFAGKEL